MAAAFEAYDRDGLTYILYLQHSDYRDHRKSQRFVVNARILIFFKVGLELLGCNPKKTRNHLSITESINVGADPKVEANGEDESDKDDNAEIAKRVCYSSHQLSKLTTLYTSHRGHIEAPRL